jgi:hypothetical protein
LSLFIPPVQQIYPNKNKKKKEQHCGCAVDGLYPYVKNLLSVLGDTKGFLFLYSENSWSDINHKNYLLLRNYKVTILFKFPKILVTLAKF